MYFFLMQAIYGPPPSMRARYLTRLAPRLKLIRAEDIRERGIMDITRLIGYYDLVSMTLIATRAEALMTACILCRRWRRNR